MTRPATRVSLVNARSVLEAQRHGHLFAPALTAGIVQLEHPAFATQSFGRTLPCCQVTPNEDVCAHARCVSLLRLVGELRSLDLPDL